MSSALLERIRAKLERRDRPSRDTLLKRKLPADIVYFWRPTEQDYGFLSMWYPSPFQDSYFPEKIYPTAEHYLLHHKALVFGNEAVAAEVLRTKSPHAARELTKKRLDNFDPAVWARHRERVVYDANWHKFTAPHLPRDGLPEACEVWMPISDEALRHETRLKQALLDTGDKLIVEAAPLDFFWGNGYWMGSSCKNRHRWGLNLLGLILMAVRARIRDEEELRKAMARDEEEN
ncbi:DUF1768-domain-containing protein [Daldinia bambusicola]|nr:DUF1768-domain-containing protein [Daldinia bambusicola]